MNRNRRCVQWAWPFCTDQSCPGSHAGQRVRVLSLLGSGSDECQRFEDKRRQWLEDERRRRFEDARRQRFEVWSAYLETAVADPIPTLQC